MGLHLQYFSLYSLVIWYPLLVEGRCLCCSHDLSAILNNPSSSQQINTEPSAPTYLLVRCTVDPQPWRQRSLGRLPLPSFARLHSVSVLRGWRPHSHPRARLVTNVRECRDVALLAKWQQIFPAGKFSRFSVPPMEDQCPSL